MKTVETVKPIGGTFAGCCRFEAFSFGSIRISHLRARRAHRSRAGPQA